MKRILYLSLLLSILISCKAKNNGSDADTTEDDEDTISATTKPLDQTQDMIMQFKPVINGVWVKKNYIKKLIRRRSPLAAADKAVGITTLYIDTTKLKGDSIMVPVSYNDHQGSTVALKFRPGRNTTTITLGNDELSYNIKSGDTTLIVYHYDTQTRETSTAKYIKVMNAQPANQVGNGMNFMINKGMISGIYEATDAAGRKYKVVFNDNGKVSGLPGVTTYLVQTNHTGDQENGLDEMIFNLNSKNQKSYAFKIERRVMSLYDTKAIGDTALVLNKLQYKLVKKG